MKYVIASVTIKGEKKELPIIFGRDVIHSGMVEFIRFLVWDVLGEYHEITSAGFYDPKTGKCSGMSESLNIKSRKQDEQIIRDQA